MAEKIGDVQGDATAQALRATGIAAQIPAKTNLPQLAIAEANKNIDALLRISYATISAASAEEADSGVTQARTQALTGQLQMGLSMLETAAGSMKNADAAWLAQRGAEYLESGAYDKAYACLMFGNSLLFAPGSFEENSAIAKIRQTASDAQGMGAKELEGAFSSGKAGELIFAYNIEMEAKAIDQSMLALMDSGARIQKLFGKDGTKFIFDEAEAAQKLAQNAVELSREGGLGEAAVALTQSQLIMVGIAEYVSALELRREMRPPARGGKEEYNALIGQADKSIEEIRKGLEKAGELGASRMNAENLNAVQQGFAENSYSIRMASAQADLVRLGSSVEGYAGVAGKRLQGAADLASKNIQEGRFEDARQIIYVALAYKETFEKSSYAGIASEKETLEQARKAAELKPGEDNLLQGRMKLGRALDYIVSNGETEAGRRYDVLVDLRGSAIALASVKAGGKQMETARDSHEGVVAEAKKNGVELDTSKVDKELGEMGKLALKGDAWGVWNHGFYATSVAIANERSGLYDALGTAVIAKQVAMGQEEVLAMNTETWNLANRVGENAKALRKARTLEEDMGPKAQVIASHAEVVAGSLRDHSWKLEELEVKAEEYKGRHLGEFAGKSTPESGREGKQILREQGEGIEKAKYLIAVGRGMEAITGDALALMQITLTGGESMVADRSIVRHMSFMNLDRAMGELESAAYALCGFDRYAEGPNVLGGAEYWKRNSREAFSHYKEAQAEVGNALAVQWSPTLQYETGEAQRLAGVEAYSKHKQDQFASVIGIKSEKNAGSAARRASAADTLLFSSYAISSHPFEMEVSGESTASNFHNAIESMRGISSDSSSMDVRASISETQSQLAYAQMNYDVGIGLEGLLRFMGATLTGPASIGFIAVDMAHGMNAEYLRTGAVSPGSVAMGAALGAGKFAGALRAIEAASGVQRGLMIFHNTAFTVLTAEGAYVGGKMLYDGIEAGDIGAASRGAQEMFKTLPLLAQTAHPGAGFLRYDIGKALRRGTDYFRSPAIPAARVESGIVSVNIGPEPGGIGMPVPKAPEAVRAKGEGVRVEVDLNARGPAPVARRPEPAPVPAEAQSIHEAVEASFSGKKVFRGEDGKNHYEYLLQDGAIPKTFKEAQVKEIEQALYYAQTIVRGELVEIPAGIRPMAERIALEPEFITATERVDALRGEGAREYDPRTLSDFNKKSRAVQISLARTEFERTTDPVQYEAEAASKKNFEAALGEVKGALRSNKGSELPIEFTFGEWRELQAGESIRVELPAGGRGLRHERVRIEGIAPAEYGGGQYIITYTVERTGSTGIVAVGRNASGMEVHNALAAKTLIDVRVFEKAAAAKAEIPSELDVHFAPAERPREFGEVWKEVVPKVQAIGDKPGVVRFEPTEKPKFMLEVNGEQVQVRLDGVKAMGGDGIYISVTPMAEGESTIFVPARKGQGISEILPTLKRKVGEALERERAAKPKPAERPLELNEPFEEMAPAKKEAAPKPAEAEMPKTVEDTLINAVLMQVPEGGKLGVGEPRMRELARRGWDEVYRGKADETPLSAEEATAYGIIKIQLNNRFNAVAEIAFEDVVAGMSGAAPKPLRIIEAERPSYGRMKNLMETVLDANKARLEAGTKPGEIISPSQFDSDYRVYLQRGVGLPEGVAKAAEAMGVKAEVIYNGKYVTEVKDASQIFAIGDIHGDPVVPISTLKGAGVIIDLRPDLPVTDTSVPFAERYRVNPEVAKGTQIIFTGDYVDRASKSVEAVEFVQWLGGAVEGLGNGSQVHTLRGNHEALFLRAYELCKGKSDAEMAKLVKDMREYSDLDKFRGNDKGAFEKDPKMKARYEELNKKMIKEFETHGLAILNIGLAPTFESILGRYGTWNSAVKGMEAEGGMVNFMRGTKAALMITGDNGRQLFTHAGPATKTKMLDADGNVVLDANKKIVYEDITNVAQLDRHYERMLGQVDNWWAYNTSPADNPAQMEKYTVEMYARIKNGDYSGLYVSNNRNSSPIRLEWSITNPEALPNLQAFSENMGITSITVGHRAGAKVRTIGEFETAGGTKVEVNCIDGALSEAYSRGYGEDWSGGILYKNSWGGNFVVQGRRDAPGKLERPTEMVPFNSPVRMENAYTEAAKEAGQLRESRPPEAARPAPEAKAPQPAPEQKPAGVGTLGELAKKQGAQEAPVAVKTLGELVAESKAAPAEEATKGKTLAELAKERAKKKKEEEKEEAEALRLTQLLLCTWSASPPASLKGLRRFLRWRGARPP